MGVKVILLAIFFVVMVGVGIYSRRHAGSVNDFCLLYTSPSPRDPG